ncbi:hypothetical protein QA596_04495 [Balneolales bacterium ANBcel1]|nr:hypothetical protein [Balneolales bacterium ANBcel1]
MEKEQTASVSESTLFGETENMADITPVLFLTDETMLQADAVRQWLAWFPAVQVAAPGDRPEYVPDTVRWMRYEPKEYRSAVWNRMLAEVSTRWALFLEDDEIVNLSGFGALDTDSLKNWPPVMIQWRDGNMLRQCYQIRLVAASKEPLFDGKNLPDCTSHITRNGINITGEPLYIHRESRLFEELDPEDELSVARPSPQVYLTMGARYFDQRKYVHAAAQYRKVMHSGDVLPYDRLAAINGLASCMAEQYKWNQALDTAVKSIRLEPKQRLPYLILYRIHQLGKRWGEAHDILLTYYSLRDELSAANFDKVLPEDETLAQLADMAFRAGMRKASYEHYSKLYMLRGGNVDQGLLHRLLLFAIEQEDFEQSEGLFKKLFGASFAEKMDSATEEQVFDYLTLFMERGWYEFAGARYQKMMELEPSNETYVRRWLVALSKSKDLKKAQRVIAGMKLRKKTG